MQGRAKFFVGGALILAAVVYLIAPSTQASAEYFMTITEMQAKGSKVVDRSIRVSGAIIGDTISYDPQTLTLKFTVADPDFKKAGTRGPLEGLTFVVTGTLPKSRDEVEEMISRNGGHAISSVSAQTDYLVLGEKPGSKFQKAWKIGVKTISYEQLVKMLKEAKGQQALF